MGKVSEKKLKKVLKVACAAFLAYEELRNHNRRKRRWWVRNLYKSRPEFGFYETSFKVMKESDPEMFFRATRMTASQFDVLLNLLKKRLEKHSIRKPISQECRLTLTIMYLAHGGPRHIYAWKFKMAACTVAKIVIETCEAIWDELSAVYLSHPKENDWINISEQYYNRWELPNCAGAIDGKHVNIVCPPKGGSAFYNYKGRHSIVLLAACNANHCLTMVDIGAYGSQSDGGILQESFWGKQILTKQIPTPQYCNLPNSSQDFPLYFVGDAAFPLKSNLMRPFPGKNLSAEKEHFNKRLSRARMTIENTFGIMAARWRIMRNDIHCSPENVQKIIKAICVLHNYLMINNQTYCPDHFTDNVINEEIVPGAWRYETQNLASLRTQRRTNNPTREAFHLRNVLTDFLYSRKYNI